MPSDELKLKSDEDVEAILRLAIQKASPTDDALRDRLKSAADELGITPEQLAAAEEEFRAQKSREVAQQQAVLEEEAEWKLFRREQLHELYGHMGVYLAVNLGLLSMDFFQNGRLDWSLFPLFGWGIGVLIHIVSTLAAHSSDNQDEFHKWRRKQRRRKGRLTEDED